ncbi:MAG: MBL fold metallo-hydrolase [Spirochaetales bacterium]|nr:MBL fold metallo-hydrolase [Spirochaetales bacterium]
MDEVRKGIFVETKTHGCNPAYVITSDGVVVIDTPQLPTKAVKMYEEAKAHGAIKYIINTELHIDHIFGNYYFQDVEHIISHQATFDGFMVPDPGFDPFDYAHDAIPRSDPEGEKLFPSREDYFANPHKPDITIDGDATLRVGNKTFQLIHTPGHTPGQLAVVIPEDKIAFVGDTLFHGCQTWLHASNVDQWLESLDKLLDLDVDIIVPGHGPVCNKQEIYVQRAFLMEWVSTIAVAVGKGWSKEKCFKEISFLDRFPVDIGQEYMGETVTRNNINSLYDKLTVKMPVMKKL